MRIDKLIHISFAAGLSLLVLALPAAKAQDQQSQGQQSEGQQTQGQPTQPTGDQQNTEQSAAPIPAYHSPFASQAGVDDEGNPTLAPDTNPLTGAQTFSLGGVNRSYWQPHADIFGSVDSNPAVTPGGGTSWGTWASFSGGANVVRISGDSNMTLNYLGGGAISSDGSAGNEVVQELGFVERLTLRRWTLAFLDQVAYLPEAAFGFGALGGIGPSTGGTIGLGTVFGVPGQTILAGTGQSLANASTAEAVLHVTGRTSLTFDAGYSLLHYLDSDLLNSTDASFQGGYNYQLTRKDTVAMFFSYSAFRYSNYNQSINDYTVGASYGRKVTGRLAFQVSAGPQIAQSRVPITGTSGASGTGSSTQLYWSLSTNLQYQLRRVALAASYYHGVEAGSGVLGGSIADIVSGSATRQMSRTFSSSVSGGYSRNTGVVFASTTPSNQTYDYWYAGASFSHPVGESLGLTFSYQFQYQNSNDLFCTGPTCGTNLTRNVFSVGVGWHERPLLF